MWPHFCLVGIARFFYIYQRWQAIRSCALSSVSRLATPRWLASTLLAFEMAILLPTSTGREGMKTCLSYLGLPVGLLSTDVWSGLPPTYSYEYHFWVRFVAFTVISFIRLPLYCKPGCVFPCLAGIVHVFANLKGTFTENIPVASMAWLVAPLATDL